MKAHEAKCLGFKGLILVPPPSLEPETSRSTISGHPLFWVFASGMARLGISPHIVKRVLNHTSGATGGSAGVYQRYEYPEERKDTLNAWGGYV